MHYSLVRSLDFLARNHMTDSVASDQRNFLKKTLIDNKTVKYENSPPFIHFLLSLRAFTCNHSKYRNIMTFIMYVFRRNLNPKRDFHARCAIFSATIYFAITHKEILCQYDL